MPKHTIRDILPPDNRPPKRHPIISDGTIRPVAPESTPQQPRAGGDVNMRQVVPERIRPDFSDLPKRSSSAKKLKYVYYVGGGVFGILLLSLLFSIFFGGAEVTVYPKQELLTVSGTFSAVSENPKANELGFEMMTLEKLRSATVGATGSEEVEVKATGQITVYNEFNDSPQRLIRNTRFETPEGLIYRIDKSVVVPGQTKKDGKDVPGSIEVTVYADEPGESYNVPITDFTIPGFKGSPQFEKFYARSKTVMAGGFVGKRLMVKDSVLEIEREKLRAQLEQDLRAEVTNEKPDGFMSFSNGVFVEFISQPLVEKGEEVEINEKAILYNVLFNANDLARHLAQNTLGNFDGGNVRFLDGVELTLQTVPPTDDTPNEPWNTGIFNFSMSGNAKIVWEFDESTLKKDLSGRNKEAITTILSGYSTIEEAEVVIRPFWKSGFPENIEDIKIETVLVK